MDRNKRKVSRNTLGKDTLKEKQVVLNKVAQVEVSTKINRRSRTSVVFHNLKETKLIDPDSKPSLILNKKNSDSNVDYDLKNEKPLFSFLNQIIAEKKDNSIKSCLQFNSQLFGCGSDDKDNSVNVFSGTTIESSEFEEGLNLKEKSPKKLLEKQLSHSSSMEKTETLPPESSVNEESVSQLNVQINDVVEVYCEIDQCYKKAKVIQIKQEHDCCQISLSYPNLLCSQKLFYIHYLDYEKRMDNWIQYSQIHRVVQPFIDSKCSNKLCKGNSKNSIMQSKEAASIQSLTSTQMNIMLTRKRSNLPSMVTIKLFYYFINFYFNDRMRAMSNI